MAIRRGWMITPRAADIRSGSLARQVEEGQRHDGRWDVAAAPFDGPLDRELRARRLVRRRHRGQTDGLLEDGAPAEARDLADLAIATKPASGKHRRCGPAHDGRDAWRKVLRRVQALDAVPVQRHADEASRRTAPGSLSPECQLPHERR